MDRGKGAVADSFAAATAIPFLFLCCQRTSPASLPRRPIKPPASGYDSAPLAIWPAPEPKRLGRMRHKSRSEAYLTQDLSHKSSRINGSRNVGCHLSKTWNERGHHKNVNMLYDTVKVGN
uniref:Uncharacterized protein n=1 Tax=Oryza punctata TaxID=4537 RepID=A0A0E0LCE4_ORYPU